MTGWTCGSCRLHFFLQAGHGLRPAPGIPCALVLQEGENEMQASGDSGRENEGACPDTVIASEAPIS
ncbi:MAG: hypothetical protein WA418_07410 [Bradyrhizobium sp.]